MINKNITVEEEIREVSLSFSYEFDDPIDVLKLSKLLKSLVNEHKLQLKQDTDLKVKSIQSGSLHFELIQSILEPIAVGSPLIPTILETDIGFLFNRIKDLTSKFLSGGNTLEEATRNQNVDGKDCNNMINLYAPVDGENNTVNINIYANGQQPEDLEGIELNGNQAKTVQRRADETRLRLKEPVPNTLRGTEIFIEQIRNTRGATGDKLVVPAIDPEKPVKAAYAEVALKERLLEYEADKFRIVITGDVEVEFIRDKPTKYTILSIDLIETIDEEE